MATSQQVQNLRTQVAAFDQINLEKLTRPTLGEESLASELAPRLKKVDRLKRIALQSADDVDGDAVNQMTSIFGQIAGFMAGQAVRPNPEFITQRQTFLDSVDSYLEAAKRWEPFFIASALEARGFLEDEGIRQEYQRTVADLKNEAETTLKEVKAEANRTIEEARALAKDIEERARRTAARVSVQEAQRQFKEAQIDLDRKVKIWGLLSALSILGFFGTAFAMFYFILPADNVPWHALYHSVLRLVVLSGVGAVGGFCLRILRAYMNMRERNLHRQRVANSIEAFVVSTQTPEVRDFILANLVEAVVAFGVSGLLTRETDTLGTQRVPVDTVTRLIGILGAKKDGS